MLAYCSLISLINLMQIEGSFGTDFSERFDRGFYIYSIFIKTSSCTKNFSFNYLFKECLFLDPSSGWMCVFSACLSVCFSVWHACLQLTKDATVQIYPSPTWAKVGVRICEAIRKACVLNIYEHRTSPSERTRTPLQKQNAERQTFSFSLFSNN